MRTNTVAAVFFAVLLQAAATLPALAGDLHFLEEGYAVYNRTLTALTGCGLTVLDHEDPRLPRPQVPADKAIVGRNGQLLAYTNYETALGVNLVEFKAPNGGFSHALTFSSEYIDYSTPSLGSVAQTSRSRTVGGWSFRFLCRSRTVDFATYGQCVQVNFVDVITSQLCR